jgi:hypothetical protein
LEEIILKVWSEYCFTFVLSNSHRGTTKLQIVKVITLRIKWIKIGVVQRTAAAARGGSKKNNEDDIFCNVGYSESCWVTKLYNNE